MIAVRLLDAAGIAKRASAGDNATEPDGGKARAGAQRVHQGKTLNYAKLIKQIGLKPE